MRAIPTEIPGVLVVELVRREDRRGSFCQTYNAELFRDLGIPDGWFMDAVSQSARAGTIRGLHFQAPPAAQAKIVRVARGAILDVVLDLRRASPTFGRCAAFPLNAGDPKQLYLPEGVAHGFCATESDTEVVYKLSRRHAPDLEGGVNPFDPDLAIDWPAKRGTAVVSDRDLGLPNLARIETPF